MIGSLRVVAGALRSRAIRSVLIAFLFFGIAEWARWIALLVYGFEHGGAKGSGSIAVIQLVPAAILTPFSSSLADRFPRARVGGSVGEIPLHRNVPRQASVTAVSDVRLLALDREPFLARSRGRRATSQPLPVAPRARALPGGCRSLRRRGTLPRRPRRGSLPPG